MDRNVLQYEWLFHSFNLFRPDLNYGSSCEWTQRGIMSRYTYSLSTNLYFTTYGLSNLFSTLFIGRIEMIY